MKELDLTKRDDVVTLMSSSLSEQDWNRKCDQVKAANNGEYPSFWWAAINLSGVAAATVEKWKALAN